MTLVLLDRRDETLLFSFFHCLYFPMKGQQRVAPSQSRRGREKLARQFGRIEIRFFFVRDGTTAADTPINTLNQFKLAVDYVSLCRFANLIRARAHARRESEAGIFNDTRDSYTYTRAHAYTLARYKILRNISRKRRRDISLFL